jgi:cbb3-type cytochrome oxidase maturation protein
MESLYLLIPIALIIIVLAIKLLFWAINNGQYDDLNTEAHRILFDEPVERKKASADKEERKGMLAKIDQEDL